MQITETTRAHVRTVEFAEWVYGEMEKQQELRPETFTGDHYLDDWIGLYTIAGLAGCESTAAVDDFVASGEFPVFGAANRAEIDAALPVVTANWSKVLEVAVRS